MNETAKTLCFAGVALVLLAAASVATWLPDWGGPGAGFDDQGEPFFPDFAQAVDDDPLAARVLEVVEYDEEIASVRPFQVAFEGGDWTIPSHHDYPADAQDRMARLAAQVAGLSKDSIRSDRADDHEELGVVDPLDDKATTLQGRGTRVTLRGEVDGEPLAEFILGKGVPDREGVRYVRVPGKNRTYAAEVDLDLSTRFSDWINTDLLELPPADVQTVRYDTRKINPDQVGANGGYVVQPGDPVVLARTEDDDDEWSLDDLGADEAIDDAKVDGMLRAVDAMKVIGVRPFPAARDNALIRSLVSKGFYPTQQGGLLSNEGSLRLELDDGLSYTLQFGEVFLGTGEALTSGAGEDQDPSAETETDAESPDADASDKDDDQTEGRYLLVTVSFDPALIPEEPAPAPSALPEDVFARDPGDPARQADDAKVAEEADRRSQRRQRLIEDAQKRVDELNRTFANWYYVVPGDDFRKVVLGRDAFIKAPGEPDSAAPTAPPSFPGGDPHGGLPPGLNIPGLGGPGG